MKLKVLLILIVALFINCQKSDDEQNEIIYVTNISIIGANISEGLTSQMQVTVFPENANNKLIVWQSSDETIAEISSSGLVTAKKNGTVTITAIASDRGTVKSTKQITITSFNDHNKIEVTNVAELLSAITNVKAGQTIILAPVVYSLTSKITITISGSDQQKISLIAKEGTERPKLDFSAMTENSNNQGVILNANFWHIKGIDFFKAGDNGLQIKGNNNLIEFCTFSECADTGLQIDNGAANNTILNCDSYFNADSSVENADGFACKLSAGTGNTFIGCRAWQNLDDGWDGYLRGTDNIETTYINCWAIKNGYLKDGSKGNGDGNGFKTGGSDDKQLKHHAIYKNCIAVGNVVDGFDHNSNRGTVTIYNCSAYENGKNYSFSNTNPLENLIIKNSNTFGSYGTVTATATDISNNSWQNGIVVTADDFLSIDYNQLLSARKTDGSLPDVTFFNLSANSDMIDKGVNVGLPFSGSAPDLGAFERN